jgi:hypothetical protein
MMMQERRSYVRANGLVLVNYKVPDLQLQGKSSAYDISGTGLRITTNQKLSSGALVEMEIYLPGSSQPIIAKGEAIWSDKVGPKKETQGPEEYFFSGIRFTVIEEDNRARVADYVRRKVHQRK